jgi:glycosyltransferase involved in cell wall biosynthesis
VEDAELDRALTDGRASFERSLRLVERCVAEGRDHLAVLLAQCAAYLAWVDHRGLHASSRLEQAMLTVGRRLPEADPPPAAPAGAGAGPLLVLTEGYAVGGHTRQTWHVIRALADRAPAVALTSALACPPFLADAVHAAGGAVHHLGAGHEDPLVVASRLRDLAAHHDQVLLVTHPWDLVPLLAWAPHATRPATGRWPRVVLVVHADHTFWTGVAVADRVVEFRAAGQRLSTERRGVEAARTCVVPLPVRPPVDDPAVRAGTRHALGVRDDDVVLLTVGHPSKYGRGPSGDFLDLVDAALSADERLVFVAAGIPRVGRWETLFVRHGRRCHVLGPRDDIPALAAAADVYLDSYPQPSGTSPLEAARAGLPIVALADDLATAPGLFTSYFPAYDGARIEVRRAADHTAAVLALAADPAMRAAVGARLRAQADADHGEEAYVRRMRAAVAFADPDPLAGRLPRPGPSFDGPPAELDRWILRWQRASAAPVSIETATADHATRFARSPAAHELVTPALQAHLDPTADGRLGVGVIAGRHAHALIALLEGLLATVGRSSELEVVVVDVDGDADVVATLAALEGHLRGIRLPPTTPRAAWDAALGALTTGRALLVTPDVTLGDGRLDALWETARAHPEADVVALAADDPVLDSTDRTCLLVAVAPLVLGLPPVVVPSGGPDRRTAASVTSSPQDLPVPDRFATR